MKELHFITIAEKLMNIILSKQFEAFKSRISLAKTKNKNALIPRREKCLSRKIGRLFTYLPRKIVKKEL